MKALFDQPDRYDEFLNQGIGITGNDKNYFIRGRLELMNQKMKQPQPRKILDFGCGTGETSKILSQLFPQAEVSGTDLSVAAVSFAKNKSGSERVRYQFFEEWIKGKEKFDLVYINCVFHHIEPNERQLTLDLLVSRMELNGEIWIFENNPINPGTRLAMYLNPFDKGVKKIWPHELKKMISKAGLKEQTPWFLFYFPEWLSAFRFMERWWLKWPLGGQYAIQARNK